MIVWSQRGMVEKLHAPVTVLIGAAFYWMLYTLREEDDTGMQDVFYSVCGVAFACFSIFKMHGLTTLHFGTPTNAKRVKQTKKTTLKTAHPVIGEDGAAFEVADNFETKGLVHY
jgi:hypothetical protein